MDDPTDKIRCLEQRLERERDARAEAEQIAERTTASLYDRQRELELLTNVATASNQAVTMQDAMHVAVTGICHHLGWPVGHGWVIDHTTGDLVSSRVWHLDETEPYAEFCRATEAHSFGPGEGLPGQVLATGRAAWITDVREDGGFARLDGAKDVPLRAAFGFPILVGTETVGVIEVFAPYPAEMDRGVLALAGQIGIQLGRVAERLRSVDEMTHHALHDSLTGLPNRVLFLDRLELALVRAARRRRLTGVLFVDLDGFKAVNDGVGHHAGDLVLQEAARRLADGLRREDTIARLGGDEFVILCEDLKHERESMELAERLQRLMLRPFDVIEGQEHLLTASIGIAIARPHETDAASLLKEADAAMYKAKDMGRARHELFSDEMRDRVLDRLRVERALSRALEADELSLHYQPIVSLDGQRGEGTEALVRWDDPDRGPQQPDDFIPIAEESTLILRVGEWVLNRACRQAAEWRAKPGYAHLLPVSVNLAARQLSDDKLPQTVAAALENAGLAPADLRLEITEAALVEGAEVPAKTLLALRKLGVRVLLDDFGTGSSSLTALQHFPVDVIKIDRSFVNDLEGGDAEAATAVIQAIVGMGHSLGLTVVAEGVETSAQATELARLGCDSGQGYLYARPAPMASFEAMDISRN